MYFSAPLDGVSEQVEVASGTVGLRVFILGESAFHLGDCKRVFLFHSNNAGKLLFCKLLHFVTHLLFEAWDDEAVGGNS